MKPVVRAMVLASALMFTTATIVPIATPAEAKVVGKVLHKTKKPPIKKALSKKKGLAKKKLSKKKGVGKKALTKKKGVAKKKLTKKVRPIVKKP